jgi:predicted aspartyl protease
VPIKSFIGTFLIIVSSSIATADSSWVPLSIDASGAIVVPVHINGRGPFRFLLDTGSSHSVMSRSLADGLNLAFIARTPVTTTTGREMRPVVKLDQTAIGTVRLDGLLLSVADSAQLAAIRQNIEGIIGQDFLFAFNYTLDYRRHRLSWTDDDARDGGTRLPLVVEQGRYLVRLMSHGTRAPVLLVPDSGSNGFVLYARDGRTPLPLEPAAAVLSVHSLSGGQDARAMILRELKLGDVTVRDQPVALVSRDSGNRLEGDGLLPLHLFDSVSFNARDKQLTIRARK